ncbi:MAG: preprotein translocase subunit SecA [Pirellulales bacterium]
MLSRGLFTRLRSLVGGPVGRRLAKWSLWLPRIEACEAEYRGLADEELRQRSLALRYRVKTREPLVRLIPEAFGLVREAAGRTLGMRHFDVQLLGGIALCHRTIVEMQTGEGKTLTATLPAYLRALAGRGVHIATANDYLAKRDADWMRPVFELLGLTAGVVVTPMLPRQRQAEYACDVTYGTAKEFGFDFLRDRLAERAGGGGSDLQRLMGGMAADVGDAPGQRSPYFALVDEADSLLIDEASTPLIISAAPGAEEARRQACFRWAKQAAGQFQAGEHFDHDPVRRTVELTPAGRERVRTLVKPRQLDGLKLPDLYDHIRKALVVERSYLRDTHYVELDGKIVIVDEFTGRLGEGRKWRDGIHQAVEAKENVEITVDTRQAARITVQDLFLRYENLSGMTGTATDAARELKRIYRVQVLPVPTHRPARRKRQPNLVYETQQAKWRAIVAEIELLHAAGRPLLIGTRSIDKSEFLSSLLAEANIAHVVLNARRLADEAEIVAAAGEPGKVTVATNMAGRGTDIHLGEGVAELGGMHVIVTEMHESARIDRQLIGRCGRQGDPGSYRVFLSLEDELLRLGLGDNAPLPPARSEATAQPIGHDLGRFRQAQKKVERTQFRERQQMMHHEKERKKIYTRLGLDPYLDAVDD